MDERTKMIKQKKSLMTSLSIVALITTVLTSEAIAINSKAIRDCSEEFLYGTKVASRELLDESLLAISKSETNPRISLIREAEEADEIAKRSVMLIEDKLKTIEGEEFFDLKTITKSLLTFLDLEKAKQENQIVSLSFLLESIEEKL